MGAGRALFERLRVMAGGGEETARYAPTGPLLIDWARQVGGRFAIVVKLEARQAENRPDELWVLMRTGDAWEKWVPAPENLNLTLAEYRAVRWRWKTPAGQFPGLRGPRARKGGKE